MWTDLRQRLGRGLERYLTHGTRDASPEDALATRRARGFALVGLGAVATPAVIAAFLGGQGGLALLGVGIMALIVAGIALGLVGQGRYVRPITHGVVGSLLAALLVVALQVGWVSPVISTFPALLVLATTYLLGPRAAFGWTVAAIGGIAWVITSLEMPTVPDGSAPVPAWAWFATGAVALIGVYGIAAVERRVADRQSRELAFLARHDPLTGLLNRRALEERLDEALARSRRYGRRFALLVIDIDGFKAVNDLHGHHAGDRVLRVLARRIAGATRSSDAACRLGGDEFAVLLEDVGEDGDVSTTGLRMLARLAERLELDGRPLVLGASLGIAIFPDAARTLPELERAADRAMYAAKAAGGDALWLHGAARPAASPRPAGSPGSPVGAKAPEAPVEAEAEPGRGEPGREQRLSAARSGAGTARAR